MSISRNEMHMRFLLVFYYLVRPCSNDFWGIFFGPCMLSVTKVGLEWGWGSNVLGREGKETLIFVIKCCSLENNICVRVCGRLFVKWPRESEWWGKFSLVTTACLYTAWRWPCEFAEMYSACFPDCSFRGFRKDLSLSLSHCALMGQLLVCEWVRKLVEAVV